MEPQDHISKEVSAIWQEMVGSAGNDDPSETLVPLESAPPSPVTEKASSEIFDTARHRRTPSPMPVLTPELAEATRHYHEFNRRYRLHRVIGEGGMGAVYLARQHALAREVAVKVLRGDDTQVMRKQLLFRAEALVSAYLEHPNIIPVYDAADHCLVMKHVRGDNLEKVIEDDRSRSAIARNVEVLIKVCDAIRFAHNRGILHRDIKAKNIMVGQFGEVLVLDWGLALSIGPGPDGDFHGPRLDRCPHVCAGTPGCLPPEIARGERDRVGAHSDLFMLGALLYHLLSGRLPFRGQDSMDSLQRAAVNNYESLARVCPEAPPRLIDACERAMASEPTDRGTVDEFVERLRRWLLTAGNEEVAIRETDEARALMTVAEARSAAGDAGLARACYLEAAAHLERAVRYLPDSETIASMRHQCLERIATPDRSKGRSWWPWFKGSA